MARDISGVSRNAEKQDVFFFLLPIDKCGVQRNEVDDLLATIKLRPCS